MMLVNGGLTSGWNDDAGTEIPSRGPPGASCDTRDRMHLGTRMSIRVAAGALIALPALVVPAVAIAGPPAPARTVMVLDCSGLGQATVALDLSRPNRGDPRVVSGGGVRLVTPLPIVATDRST